MNHNDVDKRTWLRALDGSMVNVNYIQRIWIATTLSCKKYNIMASIGNLHILIEQFSEENKEECEWRMNTIYYAIERHPSIF